MKESTLPPLIVRRQETTTKETRDCETAGKKNLASRKGPKGARKTTGLCV